MSAMTVVPLLFFLAMANPQPSANTPTTDPTTVSIDSVRIILDRKDAYVSVQQSVRFSAGKGTVFSRDKGYAISLPEGAWGARILGGEEMPFEVLEDRVLIKAPITSQGLMITISFNLPIKNSTMVLKQQLGVPVAEVQVYSNWTDGPTNLKGRGFTPAEQRELSNGVLALFVLGRNIEDGKVLITLSGLTDGVQRPRAMWTMGLSIAVLLIGLVLWLRRRGQSNDNRAA
jgi:hypothetical protein